MSAKKQAKAAKADKAVEAKSQSGPNVAPVVVATKERRHVSRKLAGTVIAVLLVLLLGALVYVKLTPPGGGDTKEIPKGKAGYDQLTAGSDKYTAKKDYDGAVQQWDQYLKENPNGQYAYEANIQAGALEQSKGDKDSALAYYQAAEKIAGRRTAHLQPMAMIYEQKGDKAKAIQYYQNYHDNFPNPYPARDDELHYLENKIKSLQQ
jgi:tetratricopeptide (TPR) repeat protein